MRVINKIEENGKPAECLCGAELEYLPSDMHEGAYGCMYITCPVCEKEILLDDEDPVELTAETLEWPKHFSLPADTDVKVTDATIQRWMNTCLSQLKSDIYKDGSCIQMGSGDSIVWMFKYEDEYAVYVSKSYAATSIPR